MSSNFQSTQPYSSIQLAKTQFYRGAGRIAWWWPSTQDSKGMIHSTKISRNLGLQLNGLTQSKWKSFKNRSTFQGGPLFLVGLVWSKLTVPFDLFDPFSISIPRCLLLSISVTRTFMCSNNSYIVVLRSVCFSFQKQSMKTFYFPRDFWIFFCDSQVVFEDLWNQMVKSGNSLLKITYYTG